MIKPVYWDSVHVPQKPVSSNTESSSIIEILYVVNFTFHIVSNKAGPQIRVGNGKLFFLFLNQNICCGYSKEPSH